MDSLRVTKVDNVILEHFNPPSSKDGQPSKIRKLGTIHLTSHHLIFSEVSILDPSTSTSASYSNIPASSPSSSSSANANAAAGTLNNGLNNNTQNTSNPLSESQNREKEKDKEIWIPYPSITLLTKLPQSIQGFYPLKIETKYFQNYIFQFEKDRDFSNLQGNGSGGAEDVWQSIKDSAVKTSVEQLHAFFYTEHSNTKPSSSSSSGSLPTSSSSSNGWNSYNPKKEFTRQGLGTKTRSWRFTDINKDYSFSATYPNKLIIPSKISDSTLSYASKYRSKARIPVLSYLHWANNASITRSSQPMVGLKNSRSAQDERLVECIFSTHLYTETAYSAPVYGATTTNLIIDARPTTNAMANVAMGAGTENMENYKLGKKAYLGIDNIHVMRNSLKIIIEAIREAETKPSGILDRTLLRKSNWLKHISTILDGSLMIIKNIHLNASHVLIHCSDGWDRTGQLSAISQICLDPYYRTIEGFGVLVEKDFCSFGHKFLDRSNHLSSEKYFILSQENNDNDSDEDEENTGGGVGATKAAQAFFASVQKQFIQSNHKHLKEISPVFHQFLDCIRQIQRQFPERFEFNEQYLLDLYYHLYSCQFGTFLFNNEKQRSEFTNKTISIWDHLIQDQYKSSYINKEFDPSLDKSTDDQGVLLYDPKDVKFWFALFKRGDEEMNGSPIILNQPQGVDVIGPINSSSQDPIVHPSTQLTKSTASSSYPNDENVKEYTNSNANTVASRNIPSSSSTSGGGWNWQGFSSGAFNAVSNAGKQIKNISQDAYNQLKAEAGEVEDLSDPWKKQARSGGELSNTNGSGSGSNGANEYGGRKEYKTYTPRTNFRIPSETNPWSSSSSSYNSAITPPIVSSDTSMPKTPTTTSIPNATNTNNHVRPINHRINSNPWTTDKPTTSLIPESNYNVNMERKVSPSFAELSLNDKPNSQPTISNIKTNTNSHMQSTRKQDLTNDEEMIRAAMGDDKKAWDPLGAL